MRKIEPTGQFKKDFKRESKGRYKAILKKDFDDVLNALAADEVLEEKYKDHVLTGEWKDCRDCHIKPDFVLIYRKIGEETLQLLRLGSHSELGL